MTTMNTDMDVLARKIDMMREDVRRLLPLLGLLEPANPDQMASFAERLISFMKEIEANYSDQTAQFSALRSEIIELKTDLETTQKHLNFLVEGV